MRSSAPTSFAECWDCQARERGDRLALAGPRLSLTWSEASDASQRLGRGLLTLGLVPGAVVACWLPNCVELYLLRVSCERAGLAWLPVQASLREWELRGILERAEPAVLVVPGRFRERDYAAAARDLLSTLRLPARLVVSGPRGDGGETTLEDVARAGSGDGSAVPPAPRPGDALVILPTTGSTGTPKLARYRVSAWLLRGRAQAELMSLRADDVIVSLGQGIGPSIIPLFAAPHAGSAVWLVDRFDPGAVLQALADVRPTIVCGVPSQLTALVQHPGWPPPGVDRLRIWYATGAGLPRATADRLEATTPGVALAGYGGVDFGGWAVPSPSDPREVRRHTVGRPRGDTELRLVDEAGRDVPEGEVGEIWGRGPCCAAGYFRDEAAAREHWTPDGWFRTGDLGRRDADENLVIVGRKGDGIRRGGRTIHPAEIEGLLDGHPKIAKVAVLGFPDPLLGERACAFVVPRSGEAVTLDDVTGWLRARRIASFKLPERMELVADLPLRGDKVDRAALRKALLDRDGGALDAPTARDERDDEADRRPR
jgi:non-ribosomal peptide synthetase component E (peptide arylation enzyme)